MIVFSTIFPPEESTMKIYSIIPWLELESCETLNLIAPYYIFSSDQSEENNIYFKWICSNMTPYLDFMRLVYKYYEDVQDICILYREDCGLDQSVECLQSVLSIRYGIVSRVINDIDEFYEVNVNTIGPRKKIHISNMSRDIILYLDYLKKNKLES